MNKERIVYDLENHKKSLELEIKKLECQLLNVENRLKHVYLDIWVYLGMIIVPLLLIPLLGFLSSRNKLLEVTASVALVIVIVVFIISLPFTTYNLIKCFFLYLINREKDTDFVWEKPAVKQPYIRRNQKEEDSYVAEKRKVVWVLNKYYLYRENYDRLTQKVQNPNGSPLSENEIKDIQDSLAQMPLYEEIKPANPFRGAMVRNARGPAVISILGVIIVLILMAVL